MNKKQRTIKSMTPKAQNRARFLWEVMHDYTLDDKEINNARDAYHAMFRNDQNFMPNTEKYFRE